MKASQYKLDFYKNNIQIYENDIYAFIFSDVKNNADASDIRQIVMEKAWVNLDQLRDPSKVKSWLFQIAKREKLQFFRKQNVLNKHFSQVENEVLESLPEDSGDILDILVNEYEKETALIALKALSTEDQKLLTLRYLDEFTPQQISKIYGEKAGTTRSKLSRALQKYKDQFFRMGGSINGNINKYY